MELTANRRPFLYFPLRRMDYATATPEVIADAIAGEIGRVVDYRPVETDGAARAAKLIAQLV